MEGIASFLTQNPGSALTFVAVLIACICSYLLFSAFKEQVSDLKKSNETFSTKFQTTKESLELTLVNHKADVNVAHKKLVAEIQKISDKVAELRQELMKELLNLRALATDTEKNLVVANQVSKLSIEALQEKLGRVILIEKSMDTFNAQITKLQERGGEQAVDIHKHQQWFASIGQSLKSHKEQLEALQAEVRKTKKD